MAADPKGMGSHAVSEVWLARARDLARDEAVVRTKQSEDLSLLTSARSAFPTPGISAPQMGSSLER